MPSGFTTFTDASEVEQRYEQIWMHYFLEKTRVLSRPVPTF